MNKHNLTLIKRSPAYDYTYAGLEIISRHLERRTRHYRTWDGRLLTSLDEVVRALLAGELMAGEVERMAA